MSERHEEIIAELTASLDEMAEETDRLRAELAAMRDALETVLPMAKGYAAANDVGRNREKIEDAVRALSPAREGGGDAGV